MIGAHAAASAGIKPRWVKYNFYTSFGGVLAMRAEVGALVVAARAKRAEDGGPRTRRTARALAIEAVKVVNAQPLALVLPSHMSHHTTHRRGAPRQPSPSSRPSSPVASPRVTTFAA